MRRTNPRARTPSHLISKSQPERLKGRSAACASMGRNGAGNGSAATFGSDPAGFAPDPPRGGRWSDAAFGLADAVQRASLSARLVSIRRPLLTERVPNGPYPDVANLSFPLNSSQSRPLLRLVWTKWNSPRSFSPEKTRVS